MLRHGRLGDAAQSLIIRSVVGRRETLRDVTDDEYRDARQMLRPEVRKRLDHVFSENRRVLDAVDAMNRGDASAFGGLMNASHDSLRTDYEVSCRELDVLVESARTVKGVLGSRMTGGGFGGCTVSLVEMRAAAAFIETVGTEYRKAAGLNAEFLRTHAAEGATVMHLP